MLKNIIIICVKSIFAATACFRSPVETSASNENILTGQTVANGSQPSADGGKEENKTAKHPNSKTFRGMINGIGFQMNLTREAEKLSGTYFYTKVGKNLKPTGIFCEKTVSPQNLPNKSKLST